MGAAFCFFDNSGSFRSLLSKHKPCIVLPVIKYLLLDNVFIPLYSFTMHPLDGAYQRVRRAGIHLTNLNRRANAISQARGNLVIIESKPALDRLPNGTEMPVVSSTMKFPSEIETVPPRCISMPPCVECALSERRESQVGASRQAARSACRGRIGPRAT